MIPEPCKRAACRFVVFLPHHTVCAYILKQRQLLFSAGWTGAFSFPVAAPLAAPERPLTLQELKNLAASLRTWSCAETRHGCIPDAGISNTILFNNYTILGTKLCMPPLRYPCSTLPLSNILCFALLHKDALHNGLNELSESCILPPITTGALANMAIRPLGSTDFSFEWKIGKAVWLPRR